MRRLAQAADPARIRCAHLRALDALPSPRWPRRDDATSIFRTAPGVGAMRSGPADVKAPMRQGAAAPHAIISERFREEPHVIHLASAHCMASARRADSSFVRAYGARAGRRSDEGRPELG